MSEPCRNCGRPEDEHLLANFADGAKVGAALLVCRSCTYQPLPLPSLLDPRFRPPGNDDDGDGGRAA